MQIWGTVSNVLHVGREPSTLIGLWPRSQKNAKKKKLGQEDEQIISTPSGSGLRRVWTKKRYRDRTKTKDERNDDVTPSRRGPAWPSRPRTAPSPAWNGRADWPPCSKTTTTTKSNLVREHLLLTQSVKK